MLETRTAIDKTLRDIYGTKQMTEGVFTVGGYDLVSMALNSFGVQLDAGLQGFPKPLCAQI